MKSLLYLMLFLLCSCAGLKHQDVATMELPFAPDLVEKMQKSFNRAPASLDEFQVEGKSSRRVYFTALYHQYLTLGHHLNKNVDLSSCPQFHHDKIETDEMMIPHFSFFSDIQVGKQGLEFFPEVVFTKNFSIHDHHQRLNEEIKTLCEEGISDNYFKFDNLVTYYANKASFHAKTDSMKAILKVPVFANYYLLKMLQSSSHFTFVHPEEKRAMAMTQIHWFEQYVLEAQKQRNYLLKNKMVRR
jgi:hypothetical protein